MKKVLTKNHSVYQYVNYKMYATYFVFKDVMAWLSVLKSISLKSNLRNKIK